MKIFVLPVICVFPAMALSAAATAQSAPPGLAITIYNDDLALVQDSRRLDLPAGRSRQEFKDVSARIRPETVTLAAAGIGIVEQNFDYDLLSPDTMMEKAVGSDVTIVRINPATGVETREIATVLAVNGGVVLKIGDRIEVLRDDGLPVRVIFARVPENLRARPTLSVTVDAERAGPHSARLSYLTSGLGWKADYVALFDETAGAMDMQGWITLTNTSGTTFKAAQTLLVAGNPNGSNPNGNNGGRGAPRGLVAAGTQGNDREQLGDYYLYPLQERTTIADRQTKQVSFLDARGVQARKAYEYRVGWLATQTDPQSFATVIKFRNASAGGLGDQLPAGTVRVYARDARGQPQFIGENQIGHTPMGSDLAIRTGEAFDVKVKPVAEVREQMGKTRWRTTMSYTITNARAAPVTVDLAQTGLWGESKIVTESLISRRVDADTVEWRVPVPANGEVKVTATFETKY
ncbi:DUF4139 domain-containing protein [Sandarakinorhabdus sp.]|uniref:DUF4139 domain-containing protein n=1 Tax=Sandarakinorhabdus sp. TaxID=1916663 RepID=UPI00286DF977|nr:DUF4139 domain-containing protein [Sandarakinorhabdus sp.]